MTKEIITYLLIVAFALGAVSLGVKAKSYHLPGNHQDYEPTQPISFSHRLHAGEMRMDCLYCHFGAERSRHAGIPASNVCMNCHKFVTATFGAVQAEDRLATEEERSPRPIISDELAKLYASLGLDGPEDVAAWNSDTMRAEASPQLKPIPWVKIHNLPDFVNFDHRAHVNVGVDCRKCHGSVETMERVRQVETLAMGWCINCHRLYSEIGINAQPIDASVDCSTCHY